MFNLDQDRKEELIEGTDVNGSTVHIKLKQTSDLDRRHIIICVLPDVKPGKDQKDGKDGCTDFRGVISAERSRIVGMSEKHGATVGIFIMEKRPKLTMDVRISYKILTLYPVEIKFKLSLKLTYSCHSTPPHPTV